MPGTIGIYASTNPAYTGGYVYSLAMSAGVVAANNFLVLTNPAGSNKEITLAGVFASSVIVNDIAATVDPLRGYRASNVSGGTLALASEIAKIRTSMPSPAGQIRTGNPTVTLGAAWFNSPPILGTSKTSSPFVHQIPTTTPAGSLTLSMGESTVIRTESGDVDQRWNISIAWSET